MSTLERVVRPFQRVEPFQPRVLPPDPHVLAAVFIDVSEPEDAGHIEVKGSADGQYNEGPPIGDLPDFTVEWKEDEKQRQTETVKIENANDPDQFLEVQRIKQMVLRNTKTAEEIRIKPTF